jgi:hypothetical protein
MSSNHNSPVLYSPYSPPEPNSLSPWSQGSHFGSENSGYDSLTLPPINPDADNNYGELPSFINNEYFALPHLQDPFLPEAPTASRSQDDEQAPPASNQQTRAPRQRPVLSQYGFGEFESPDPFDGDFDELANFVEALDRAVSPPAEMPNPRTTTRRSSIVDLTSSPPDIRMATTRKRKAEEDAAGQGRAAKKTARAAKSGEASTSSSRRQSLGEVEVVDLADVENESQYRDLAAKQQAELIKKQNEDEAKRPVKLAAFQCIICMDNPTDLTVTHCGMYSLYGFERSYLTL